MNPAKYQVRLSWDDAWHMDRPHFHEDIEVLLCLSDGGDFFIENELFPLRAGALYLIDEATLHKSIASEGYKRYVLHISPASLQELSMPQSDFLDRLRHAGHCVFLAQQQTETLIALFRQLEAVANRGEFGDDVAEMLLLLALLLEVFRSFEQKTQEHSGRSPDFERIAPVMDYINLHLAEPMTLDEIAAHCFINKFHMCHSFKAITGFSVVEYIIHCRVFKARALLRKGMRVQEVGEAVGFRNNEHFIRTFGKLTGSSPKRYAKEYLESDEA